MGMFDAYVHLPTPPIPPYAELPTDEEELRKLLFDLYLTEDSIRTAAYWLWEREGKLDGEQQTEYGRKLRDVYWWQAEAMLECNAEVDLSTVRLGLVNWQEHQAYRATADGLAQTCRPDQAAGAQPDARDSPPGSPPW